LGKGEKLGIVGSSDGNSGEQWIEAESEAMSKNGSDAV
jgi:hypothetical protein